MPKSFMKKFPFASLIIFTFILNLSPLKKEAMAQGWRPNGVSPSLTRVIEKKNPVIEEFFGEVTYDNFGNDVSNAGDVNGDGYADIMVAAIQNDQGGDAAGKVYIFFGGPLRDDIADVEIVGQAAKDYLGFSCSGAGDVNNDGFDDVIIGVYEDDTRGDGAGKAILLLGGNPMDNVADAEFFGEVAGDSFGRSVSGAGNVNGDEYADIIIGASGNDQVGFIAGKAYIYYGSASLDNIADVELLAKAAWDRFGESVSSAGDVNNDGFDDVIVGAFEAGNAGEAYIFLGATAMDATADLTMTGEFLDDDFGSSVSTAGDVNNDGFDDVLIGAPVNSENGLSAGKIYVFNGGSPMNNIADVKFKGKLAYGYLGHEHSIAAAGDINNDGFDDIIAGAYGDDAGGDSAGRAFILFGGSPMNNVADIEITGEAASDLLGKAVSGAGDFDGDHCDDILIGATGNDETAPSAGKASVFAGCL